MKAMILAAGLGTRLRPLTDDRPKALVEVAEHPLLEITLRRLRNFGVREVIINAHHFAELLVDYLRANNNFGMQIEISREDVLLDTGGGLKKAAHFFLHNSAHSAEPFLLHNVDVISNIDLERMVKFHVEKRALATLAVQHRKTSRYLLFDDQMQLCGRISGEGNGQLELARPESARSLAPLGFCGVNVISPRLLTMMTEEGVFSIVSTYLRLVARGEKICGFGADAYYWRDLGKPEHLEQATADVQAGAISI